MITPPEFTFGILIYGILTVGVFGVLWVCYDRRDHASYEVGRRKITFHCIRCDHLYTDKPGTETATCPKCSHTNNRLKF